MFVDFDKFPDSLVPAIVQDSATQKVLMLGYMSAESLEQTRQTGNVTFFSRSRQKIWVKGETSGHHIKVADITIDCDNDTLLIKAIPSGPSCHTGADTCFSESNRAEGFLFELEDVIRSRKQHPVDDSYTSSLFAQGLNRIAQKVGEEAVELIIEAREEGDENFKAEAADLLYHLMVLFVARDVRLHDVLTVLQNRAKERARRDCDQS